jgi:hypothetical protein
LTQSCLHSTSSSSRCIFFTYICFYFYSLIKRPFGDTTTMKPKESCDLAEESDLIDNAADIFSGIIKFLASLSHPMKLDHIGDELREKHAFVPSKVENRILLSTVLKALEKQWSPRTQHDGSMEEETTKQQDGALSIFQGLPAEIWCMIFSFCDSYTQFSLRSTSVHLRRLTESYYFSNTTFRIEYEPDFETTIKMLQRSG